MDQGVGPGYRDVLQLDIAFGNASLI
jgi:hypothetical protein